jgi:demethylmenaquinone methyltransferase/2-methoxy-6-polyprenyl-1,4-benzoquinol methylase
MNEAPLISSLDRPTNSAEVRRMFDSIAPTYDVLNTVLSLGLHRVWEKRLVVSLPVDKGATCLDLCTGTGALVPRLATRFDKVVGADISPQMLAVARKRWTALANCEWREVDAQAMPFSDSSFDAITVAYGVRNLPDPERGLSEMWRVCVEGGWLAVLEFGQPRNRMWRGMFSFYSNTIIPFIGGLISGQRRAYQYLPKTSAKFPCGSAFEEMMIRAGWSPERTISLCGGVAFIYLGRKHGS